MNRAVQRMHQRRCALKSNLYGGGLNVNPEASFVSNNGVPYAENQYYSECYDPVRPGSIVAQGNPALAQTAMAGGRRLVGGGSFATNHPSMAGGGCGCNLRRQRGGQCGVMRSRRLKGGQCGVMKGGQCGLMKGGQCGLMKGGQCGVQKAWLGGKRRTRRMRGGNKGGFEMAVAQNIGGNGPIAEPVRIPVPCDARAGMQNPFTATPVNPDPRAALGYSLTPNTSSMQRGGQLSERVPNFEYSQTGAGYGNAYDASCYRAPGSEMPVYPATSAGFHFTPSTEAGAALPDGVTAFNEVVAHTARLGGARRRTYRKRSVKRGKSNKRNRRH
jgi:hypothetical protein